MKKTSPLFIERSGAILMIIAALFLSTLVGYCQNDGFLFEDLELDIAKDSQSAVYDSELVAGTSFDFSDSSIGLSEDDLLLGVMIPQEIEGTRTDTSTLDSVVLTAADNKNDKNQKSKVRKIRFYQKWWFTLLVFIPVGYFSFLYYKKNNEELYTKLKSEQTTNDALNKSLLEKDEYYQKKEEEYKAKLIEEEELKFQAVGLNKFSEIISNNKDDLTKLGQNIIFELVEFIGANAGAIYIVNGETEETKLNLLSAYAPDKKQLKGQFSPGEGYVGTCYAEEKLLEIDNVPETYAKIESGLGKARPKYLAFFPLLQDEQKLGVIEIAAFQKLDTFKIEFIQKLSQNLASSIAIQHATDKMHEMLEQSKVQAEELRAQEEELRQNLEEMQATQEQLNRQAEENKEMQKELLKENAFMEAIMNNLPDYIYFKDLESKFIKNSLSHTKIFGFDNPKDLLGKSDFDFFSKEHAQPAFEAEQKIIKTGKPIIDLVEKEVKKDGAVSWVTTTKLPLRNSEGKIIGTFGISRDISKTMKLEMETREKNEELLAQEEELRQNLEEMQTVQEELQRQKDELAKEQALMETLLKNANESIYFKDSESRFIKASDSMAKMFKVKSVKELYGKTDFDFFTEEHAKPAFYDEMNIIKTKKPIVDKIEKETHPDGRVSWVSTTKMPLLDHTGKAIGTFGISKDITKMKIMQEELRIDKAQLDALMNHLPDYIYFKDEESKFIRISKSMLKLFPFDKLEDMVGKSDFDFQPKKSAKKYFDEEMKIIKTGKGFVDHVEHEVMENGVEQWVSTTKMPLYDQTGKCIGTFGISKDISHLKLLERKVKKK